MVLLAGPQNIVHPINFRVSGFAAKRCGCEDMGLNLCLSSVASRPPLLLLINEAKWLAIPESNKVADWLKTKSHPVACTMVKRFQESDPVQQLICNHLLEQLRTKMTNSFPLSHQSCLIRDLPVVTRHISHGTSLQLPLGTSFSLKDL